MLAADGSVKLPGLDNHAIGRLFEELVRRMNEENNEEAGEHCRAVRSCSPSRCSRRQAAIGSNFTMWTCRPHSA